MSPSPKEFYVGVIDFFSVLLPGAMLTYFLKDWVKGGILPRDIGCMAPAEKWIVFAVSSYLLGHFVFLLGSWLDEWYDMLRNQTLNHRIKQLARTGKLMLRFKRGLLWLVFKRERDLAVDRAGWIKERDLKPVAGKQAVNTFQWSKARLSLEKPDALAVVQRLEADSKFFRSLVTVLVLLLVFAPWDKKWYFIALNMVLVPMALWRYMEQRYKATNQAYWFILALDGKDAAAPLPVRKLSEPTHAGGVVYRCKGKNVEYLLVEAKNTRDEWVLPKGHIELNEQPRETAVREVHEETRVWAAIEHEFAVNVEYELNNQSVRVKFYLMRCLEAGWKAHRLRQRWWGPFNEAQDKAKFDDAKDLLSRAHQILSERQPCP